MFTVEMKPTSASGVTLVWADETIEINGLMTYDRKVLKFDPFVLRTAHKKVFDAARR